MKVIELPVNENNENKLSYPEEINKLVQKLQNKNIVSVSDGRNIGNIIDVKIDEETGEIISLIVEPNKAFFTFSNKGMDTEIKWKNITKIGEDVILVNITL